MFGIGGSAGRCWGPGVGAIVALVGLSACRERPQKPLPSNGPPAALPAAPIVRAPPAPRLPPPHALVLLRRDTTLAVLPLGPDTITALAQVAKPVPAHRVVAAAVNAITGSRTIQWPAGVVALQLTDRQHGTLYTTTFPAQQDSLGRLVAAISVSATPMRLDGEPAVFLMEVEDPHTRARGEAWQVILPRGNGAVATGRIADLVTRPVRASMDAPIDALPGRQVVVEVNSGMLLVEVPLEIAPDSATAIGGVIPRPTHDVATGLGRFTVARLAGPTFPSGSTPHNVPLYRLAQGDSADTVAVAPTSTIEFGDAYGTVTVERDDDPSFVEEVRVGVARLRLAVTIDGRVGFVDPRDFPHVGLQPLD